MVSNKSEMTASRSSEDVEERTAGRASTRVRTTSTAGHRRTGSQQTDNHASSAQQAPSQHQGSGTVKSHDTRLKVMLPAVPQINNKASARTSSEAPRQQPTLIPRAQHDNVTAARLAIENNTHLGKRDETIAKLERDLMREHTMRMENELELQRQLQAEQERAERRKVDLDDLKAEFRRKQHNANVNENTSRSTIDTLQRTIKAEDQQNAQITAELDHVTKSLEDCKEHVFDLQPLQALTDDQIGEKYENLCSAIQTWVATTFEDVDNGLAIMLTTLKGAGEKQYIAARFKEEELGVAMDFPQVDNNMLASFFFRLLFNRYLHPKRFVPDMSEHLEGTLHAIIKSMTKLDPPKNREAIQMWRVDMYRALDALQEVKEMKEAAMKHMLETVIAHFETILPSDSEVDFNVQECCGIIAAAVDLAHNIRMSTVSYKFDFIFDPTATIDKRSMFVDEVKTLIVINSSTGQPVKASSMFDAAQDGKIGEKLCTLHPALVRRGTGGGEDITISKATVVVKFDHEVKKITK